MGFRRWLRYGRSPYLWITLLGAVWIGFLDNYSWWQQWRLARRLAAMEAQLSFYEQAIRQLRQEEAALERDTYLQEWYARQHYWVKRPTERLIILTPKR
ncbi:MAG: hypothetical protein NZ958_05880 [Bacteroidia bacterium]|nr:hypothetical protein [Bacteroidia bacterium]MDW8088851.1 hypothetical protein [Bacteroidia bacterium]